MTTKCANPACSVPFHRLGRGKLFRFEVKSPSEPCRDVPDTVCSVKSGRASVFFWLCDNCSLTKTLSFEAARGLTIELIPEARNYAPIPRGFDGARRGEQAS
jgi:hypothetical protein